MADEYIVLNGQNIPTLTAVESKINSVTSKVNTEVSQRKSEVTRLEGLITSELNNRIAAVNNLQDALNALKQKVEVDSSVGSISDFYQAFLQECETRRVEDAALNKLLSDYVKEHSAGNGGTTGEDYRYLENKPWVKYKDENEDVHLEVLEGGVEQPLDLTAIGGKKNFNKLENTPSINGLPLKNSDENKTTEIELKAKVHQYKADGTYDADGEEVRVDELEFSVLSEDAIRRVLAK